MSFNPINSSQNQDVYKITFRSETEEELIKSYKEKGFDKYSAKIVELKIRCQAMKSLSDIFLSFSNLKVLDLSKNKSLIKLDDSIVKLSKLEDILLKNCIKLSIISEKLSELSSLKVLNISYCDNLKYIPKSLIRQVQNGGLKVIQEEEQVRVVKGAAPSSHFEEEFILEIKNRNFDNASELLKKSDLKNKQTNQIALIRSLADCKKFEDAIELCRQIENSDIKTAWLKHLYGLDLDTKVQELGSRAELSEFSKLIKAYIQDPKDNLEIKNDKIDCLPEIWNNLILIENLKKLTIDCINLKEIPKSISTLKNLKNLELSGCKNLKELPDEIINLKSCDINVSQTGITKNYLDQFLSKYQEEEEIPSFFYSMEESDSEGNNLTLEKNINLIFEKANYAKIEFKTLLSTSTVEQKTDMNRWLRKLDFVTDSKDEKFYQNIVRYLWLANDDPKFCDSFWYIMKEAGTTCGDKIAWCLLLLGHEYERVMIRRRKTDFSKIFQHAKTSCVLDILENHARKKVETLHEVDEIETYLVYPIKLKDALKLSLSISTMQFANLSGVEEDDLNRVYDEVIKSVTIQKIYERVLTDFRDVWVSYVKENFNRLTIKSEELFFEFSKSEELF